MERKWRKYLSILGAALVFGCVAMAVIPTKAEVKESDTIPKRVFFGEVAVGGMDKEGARGMWAARKLCWSNLRLI